MRVAVIDDYQDVFKDLSNFHRLKDHEVVTFSEPEKDVSRLAARLKDFDAVMLTQHRTSFGRALIEQLPNLPQGDAVRGGAEVGGVGHQPGPQRSDAGGEQAPASAPIGAPGRVIA